MILIGPVQMRALIEHCEAAYPEEACGLLIGARRAGRDLAIERVEAAANLHAEPRHRFELDPALHLAWQRRLRGTARAVVGHYHSHPDGEARPSAHDRDMAMDPELVWLVAAVHAGRCLQVTAHRLADGRFRETPLRLQTTKAGRPRNEP